MLQAKELGLDTCWCNYFTNSKLEELFDIPENEKSVLIMPIGYASDESKPSQMHKAKKELSDVVIYM